MVDVVSRETRSRMMAGIKAVDTSPEKVIRFGLHRLGLRYRLHQRNLPGRPDLVFPRHRVVIFVNGCFWHRHDCHLFKWPQTRKEFWREKLNANAARDEKNLLLLKDSGWRVMTIWECSIRQKSKLEIQKVLDSAYKFVMSDAQQQVLKG